MNSNMPTVAVHAFAQHATAGEMVAGTHGRSLWVLDVTALRQMTKETIEASPSCSSSSANAPNVSFSTWDVPSITSATSPVHGFAMITAP